MSQGIHHHEEMTRKIFKYEIGLIHGKPQVIELPFRGTPVRFKLEYERAPNRNELEAHLYMWYEFDQDFQSNTMPTVFCLEWTGQPFKHDGKYLDTMVDRFSGLVWHIYQLPVHSGSIQ